MHIYIPGGICHPWRCCQCKRTVVFWGGGLVCRRHVSFVLVKSSPIATSPPGTGVHPALGCRSHGGQQEIQQVLCGLGTPGASSTVESQFFLTHCTPHGLRRRVLNAIWATVASVTKDLKETKLYEMVLYIYNCLLKLIIYISYE